MEKRSDRILGSLWLKIVAIALFVISILTFALSTDSIVVLCEYDAYRKEENFRLQREELFFYQGLSYARSMARYCLTEQPKENVLYYTDDYMTDDWKKLGWNFDADVYGEDGLFLGPKPYVGHSKNGICYSQTYDLSFVYGEERLATEEYNGEPNAAVSFAKNRMKELDADFYHIVYDEYGDPTSVEFCRSYTFEGRVEIDLYEDPLISDRYTVERDLVETGYRCRYLLIALCALSFILTVTTLVTLAFAAGRRKGVAEIVLGPLDRIPFDLYTALFALAVVAGLFACEAILHILTENIGLLILPVALAVVLLLFFCLWYLSFAARIKAGKWWRNTLIARLFHGIRLLFRGIGRLIGYIPTIWKALLFLTLACLLGMIATAFLSEQIAIGLIFWFADWILISGAVIAFAIMLSKLAKGARRIAEGRPDAKIDTERMTPGFRRFAEDLNHIDDGIRRAVDEQMKSERLKTELITNVSHDIKTPLTSIINYVDLLEREGAVSPEGQPYLEVLTRQSARLKKLIEDLIQASKASTGNLETHLIPTDAAVLAQQIVGEYRDRLEEAGLEMICKAATERTVILADGQLLYRVFDNLLGNICKYAQPGTRVYLDVTDREGKIAFLFRNISKEPLHISPDELTERFVRGDSSRNTEGSGLGLSIAKSLTELQGGRFEIDIDGDLFKATVEFDRME